MSSPSDSVPLPRLLRWLQPREFPHKLGLRERLFARGLARHRDCWVETAAGLTWRLDLRNPTHRWIVYGYYEGTNFLRWVRKNVPDGGVVVDSGANIGQMALYFGHWFRNGRVLAFEPGAAAASWLESCLQRHPGLSIELIRAGLSDCEGTASLANSMAGGTNGSQAAITAGSGEEIRLVRLDAMLAGRGITELSLWKLDVEGHEIPALRGAGQLLAERRIKALYVELCGENGDRIRELLSGFGYLPYDLSFQGEVKPLQQRVEHGNALFLPS